MSRGPTALLLLIIPTILLGFSYPAQVAENQGANKYDKVVVDWLRPLFETVSANPWIQSFIVILIVVDRNTHSLLTGGRCPWTACDRIFAQ